MDYSLGDVRKVLLGSEVGSVGRELLLKRLSRSKFMPRFDDLPVSLRWNLCRVKLGEGRWDWKGWELRSDWSVGCRRMMEVWDGKKEGKLIVLGEEGVGDELMAASCFDDLPDCVIECDSRLLGHFQRSFPRHEFIERSSDWATRAGYDFMLPMLDLFRLYRRSPKSCPGGKYLTPDPERVAYWREVLPYRVGLSWKSRHGEQSPMRMKGVSLQYGIDSPEWMFVPDLDPVRDFADQINLIAALDSVISGPMSVVHAAGALGVKTHVIMPPRGSGDVWNGLHWRYMCGLPFYANSTVYANMHDFKKRNK